MAYTVPNTFATQSGNVPASQLDGNFTAVLSGINNAYLVGTLASRPAPDGIGNGRFFFATDTGGGTLYRDNGTSWVQVAAAVAPVNMTIGVVTFQTGGTIPAATSAYFGLNTTTGLDANVPSGTPFRWLGAGIVQMTLTSGGSWSLASAGPHAMGGATVASTQLTITGSFSATSVGTGIALLSTITDSGTGSSTFYGMNIAPTITSWVNDSVHGFRVAPTLNKAPSGTHPDFTSVQLEPPTIGAGAAALTNATTLKITGAPTVGTNLRALWSSAAGAINEFTGVVKLAMSGTDDITWGRPLVALGGGVAPTFGTIGGTGPAAAAQRGWLRVIESDGVASFISVWR